MNNSFGGVVLLIGLMLLVGLVLILVYFGFPATRVSLPAQHNVTTPQVKINLPSDIDVNVGK